MRANLENNLARQLRLFSPSHEVLDAVLDGSFPIPDDGPMFYFLDGNGVQRDVFLPGIPLQGGLQYLVVNTGGVNLIIYDALGTPITTLPAGLSAFFCCSRLEWTSIIGFPTAYNDLILGLLTEPRVVTADFVAASTDTTIAVQRVAPAQTFGTLPAVLSRAGRPISVVDWSSGVVSHEIQLVPNGAETIMQQATWSLWSNAGNLASITLWPSVALNGWYVKP